MTTLTHPKYVKHPQRFCAKKTADWLLATLSTWSEELELVELKGKSRITMN